MLYQSIPVIPGCFNLTYITNPGAVFGLFAGLETSLRETIFLTTSIIAIAIIITCLYKYRSVLSRAAFTLILAGALGNLVDRLRQGAVIDFIDLYVGQYHWPAFNIADSAITIGVTLLIWDQLRYGEQLTKQQS